MATVLVVEDDPIIRDLITWKLTLAGYAAVAEADGEAGLALATGDGPTGGGVPPDLVLLDWMMPKMTGIDVCRALRSNSATADVPIIMLTAKAHESEIEKGFEAGVDDYIVKPFSPRELVRRVDAVLARSERAR